MDGQITRSVMHGQYNSGTYGYLPSGKLHASRQRKNEFQSTNYCHHFHNAPTLQMGMAPCTLREGESLSRSATGSYGRILGQMMFGGRAMAAYKSRHVLDTTISEDE